MKIGLLRTGSADAGHVDREVVGAGGRSDDGIALGAEWISAILTAFTTGRVAAFARNAALSCNAGAARASGRPGRPGRPASQYPS